MIYRRKRKTISGPTRNKRNSLTLYKRYTNIVNMKNVLVISRFESKITDKPYFIGKILLTSDDIMFLKSLGCEIIDADAIRADMARNN